MNKYKTLVLNADFSPISVLPLHVISGENAVSKLFADNCDTVVDYGKQIKTTNPNFKMMWPAVIVRREYVHRTQRPVLSKSSLFYRDKGHCAYCGIQLTLDTITRDHVIPMSRGGKDDWDNVVACCPTCNYLKSNHLPEGRWKPKITPYKPSFHELVELRKLFPVTINHPSWRDYLGDWKGEVRLVC